MKKYNFNNLDEFIYEDILDCGFRIYYYPKVNTKNFYISVTTPYSAKVNKYKRNNKIIDIIPGTAHFLEHRLIDFNVDNKAKKELDKLGSFTNAYTSYSCTNYNIYGSIDINKNIELLLNKVFNPVFTDKDIQNEKGIINEEIDMTNDQVGYEISRKSNNNLFYNSFLNTPILGSKESIDKINAKYLERIYNDMYDPSKMFLVITGGFDLESVREFVLNYFKDFKVRKRDIEIIKKREKPEVKVEYEETQMKVTGTNVQISYKMPLKLFKFINKNRIISYLNLLLNMNFSRTSDVYEKLKLNNVFNFGFSAYRVDSNVIITFNAVTENKDYFIKTIHEQLNNLIVDEKSLERKKRVVIAGDVTVFEDFVNVENIIVSNLLFNKKFKSNTKKSYEEINVTDMKKVNEVIDISNRSILVVNKF